MTILLLRHASAGSRESWLEDDRFRPLDAEGVRQAAVLASSFDEYGLERIVSSPARRCVETIESLAARLTLSVEEREEVAADAATDRALALLHELDHRPTLVCTHREVIVGLLGLEHLCQMGSAWVLEPDGDHFAPTVYLPSP